MTPDEAVAVANWRRLVHGLYVGAREAAAGAVAHRAWRDGRDELFREHPASPLLPEDRPGFTGLEFPAYDERWRFEADIEEAPPVHLDVPTGSDGIVPFDRVGVVRIDGIGSLDVWWLGSYGGGFFIPVKDASAGKPGGTYGGGRYLIDTVKGADLGRSGVLITLDFNYAYNPSCAYDEQWACPLAPPGNTVAVDIPVGERTFHD